MYNLDRIYRIFSKLEELKIILAKEWKGKGIHALPGCPQNSQMKIRFLLEQSELKIKIKSVDNHLEFRNWSGPRKKEKKNSFIAFPQNHINSSISVPINSLKIITDVDYSQMISKHIEIKLQALDTGKLHCNLLLGKQIIPNQFMDASNDMLLGYSGTITRG